jgi:opacity protein-like surface antigen
MCKNLCAVVLFLAVSVGACASDLFPVYLGGGYGIARYVGDEIDEPLYLPGQRLEDDLGFYEVFLGLKLGDLWSIELNYADFGDAEGDYDSGKDWESLVDARREQVSFSRLSAMAVLDYPLVAGLSVFGTVGYAYYDFDRLRFGGYEWEDGSLQDAVALALSDGDHGMEYGFGMKYSILAGLKVRGQWTQSVIGDRSVQSNRLSVEWHF